MTMLFRDIIEECRIRGVKAAEWIESFLFREVFNQPLRIVYNIIQEEDSKMNMNTGLYNTLSPYLFDAAYHLTPVRAESMIIEKVALKDNSHLRDESGQNHLTPISEEKQEIQAEAEHDPFVNDMPEKIITETFLASERPSDNPEQPLVSVPEKTAKKVKKEKKQKKKSYPSVGLSGFALWLLIKSLWKIKKSNGEISPAKKTKLMNLLKNLLPLQMKLYLNLWH